MAIKFRISIVGMEWVVKEIGKFFIKIQVHRYVEYAIKKSNETNFVRKLHWTNQGKRF